MRIAAISDVHAGNHRRFGGQVAAGLNRRCSQIVAALRLACTTAREQKCEALLVCGDLFDGVRPEPQVIAAVMGALKQGPESVYVIKGNHDSVSDVVGDHALGPLDGIGEHDVSCVYVADKPGRYQGLESPVLVVPFQSGPAGEWLPAALDAACAGMDEDEDRAVVALHLGVQDERTPPFLRDSADSIPATVLAALMKERGIQVAFAGNWHDHLEWVIGEQTIIQVGALCPTGFDNCGGDYGRLVIWESDA